MGLSAPWEQISGQFARLLLTLVLANYITLEDNRIITSSNSSYDTSRALRNGRLTCTENKERNDPPYHSYALCT